MNYNNNSKYAYAYNIYKLKMNSINKLYILI